MYCLIVLCCILLLTCGFGCVLWFVVCVLFAFSFVYYLACAFGLGLVLFCWFDAVFGFAGCWYCFCL